MSRVQSVVPITERVGSVGVVALTYRISARLLSNDGSTNALSPYYDITPENKEKITNLLTNAIENLLDTTKELRKGFIEFHLSRHVSNNVVIILYVDPNIIYQTKVLAELMGEFYSAELEKNYTNYVLMTETNPGISTIFYYPSLELMDTETRIKDV